MKADLQRPNVIEALQKAAQRHGMKDIAAEMDMTLTNLYAVLNPYGDRNVAKMGLELALGIMRYTGDKTALALMARELGCSLIEMREPDQPTLAEEILQDYHALCSLAQAMRDKQGPKLIHELTYEVHSEIEQTVGKYLQNGWQK